MDGLVWFVMVLEGILVCYLDLFKLMSYGLYHGKSLLNHQFVRICLELFPSIVASRKPKVMVDDGRCVCFFK